MRNTDFVYWFGEYLSNIIQPVIQLVDPQHGLLYAFRWGERYNPTSMGFGVANAEWLTR